MFVLEANHRFGWRQWLLAVALCLPAVSRGDDPHGAVIDRAVAIVNGQVLTLSELDLEARVLLVAAGGVQAATAPLDDEALRAALDAVISNRLAFAEAEALQAYPLEPAQLAQAVNAFKARFDSQGAWLTFLQTHEVDQSAVEACLARQLRAQRVLDGKLRIKAQVTESEALRYQAEHPEVAAQPLSKVREAMFARRFKALAAAEMKQARRQAKVRLLGPFAEAALDGGML